VELHFQVSCYSFTTFLGIWKSCIASRRKLDFFASLIWCSYKFKLIHRNKKCGCVCILQFCYQSSDLESLKYPYALCHSHWVPDRCPFEFMCRYGPYMVEVSIAHTCMSYRICPPLLICFFKINNHLFSSLSEHHG
jgi:hypothetical protein